MFMQGQYDDGRNMPLRLLEGIGLKFRLSNTPHLKLYLATGIMYEYERWRYTQAEGGEITKGLIKSSNYLNSKYKINDKVQLNSTLYYQGGYDGDDEVFRNRINGDCYLEVKLTERLSFLTNFSCQYEDKPIIPIKKFVYALSSGLKLNF